MEDISSSLNISTLEVATGTAGTTGTGGALGEGKQNQHFLAELKGILLLSQNKIKREEKTSKFGFYRLAIKMVQN